MIWYGFLARLDAIFHKIRHPRHKMSWRSNADEICDGDIVCKTCNSVFWCRAQELTRKKLKERIEKLNGSDSTSANN